MKKINFIILPILMFFLSCNITTIHHDEDMAAKSAQMAAEKAFIEKDFESLEPLLAKDFIKQYGMEEISRLIFEMHPNGFPTKIRTTEFEPIPGKQAMNIFLLGEGKDQKFFYRFLMVGTSKDGYKVSGTLRGNGPYPKSKLIRPL